MHPPSDDFALQQEPAVPVELAGAWCRNPTAHGPGEHREPFEPFACSLLHLSLLPAGVGANVKVRTSNFDMTVPRLLIGRRRQCSASAYRIWPIYGCTAFRRRVVVSAASLLSSCRLAYSLSCGLPFGCTCLVASLLTLLVSRSLYLYARLAYLPQSNECVCRREKIKLRR